MFTPEEATVEHVSAYVESLVREVKHYTAQKVGAESVGDADKAAYWQTRVDAVGDELERVKALDVKPAVRPDDDENDEPQNKRRRRKAAQAA